MHELNLQATHHIHGGVVLILTTIGAVGAAGVTWKLLHPSSEPVRTVNDALENTYICPPCELKVSSEE